MSNRKQVDSVIERSAYKDELREVFSDHFDDVTKPVSVSLGVYMDGRRIDEVVGMLRRNGIDAMPYYDPKAAENPNAFIVDGTGVRSPFFAPSDAIKATADVFETMKRNGLSTSRALPVAQANLIPAITRAYDNKKIDVARNNESETDVDAFLAKQLSAVNEMPAVENRSGKLYRGGTLGDKPFALTFHRCQRDAAYATKDFDMAATYADGVKGAGLQYKQTDGKTYGFIYEFEPKAGQRYYSMAGIERPEGSAECVGHADNRDDYETLIVPERNPLSAIYLKVDDKIVQIADKKGYLSKDWERFSALTAPRDISENNDFMAARRNDQLNGGVTVSEYKKSDKPLPDSYQSFTPDIRGLVFGDSIKTAADGKSEIENANFSSIKLPDDKGVSFTGDFCASNCVVGKTLDLSKCTGIVGLCDCDLRHVESIKYPEQCKMFFLSNVRLPENGALDLGKMKCDTLTLEDQDCTKLKRLTLPENTQVKLKGTTKLPEQKSAPSLMKSLSAPRSPSPAKQPLMQTLGDIAAKRQTQTTARQTPARDKSVGR